MRHFRILFFIAALFLALPLLYGEDVQTTEGRYFEKVSSITARGGKRFLQLSGGAQIPLEEVVKIRYLTRNRDPLFFGEETTLALRGGDILKGILTRGGSLDIGIKLKEIKVKDLDEVSVSLDYIRGLFFLGPLKSPGQRREFFEESLRNTPKKDLLLLKKGGQIPCVIQSIAPHSISYEVSGLGNRQMEVKKILALRVAPLGGKFSYPSTPYVRIHLDGGEILSGEIEKYEAEKIHLKTFFDKTLIIPDSRIFEIYFFNGNFQYLSDLKASKTEVTPGIATLSGLSFPPQRDRNVLSKALRLGGIYYSKGLGLHSKTKLTYSLEGKYTSLNGKFGFDDSVTQNESPYTPKIIFRIYGDGKKLYDSGIFTPEKKALPIKVPLKGVKILQVEVDFGEPHDDVLGRVNFVDPYLVSK